MFSSFKTRLLPVKSRIQSQAARYFETLKFCLFWRFGDSAYSLASSSLNILMLLLRPLKPLLPLFRLLGRWVLRPLLMYVLVALLLRLLLASLL